MAESKEILNSTEGLKPNVESRKTVEVMTDLRETSARVPHEIKTWLQKIEEDPGMANPISDQSGSQVLTPSAPQNPKVVLPVSRNTFLGGFKKSIDDASRWLSTFLLRLIKMKKGNVKFKEE